MSIYGIAWYKCNVMQIYKYVVEHNKKIDIILN